LATCSRQWQAAGWLHKQFGTALGKFVLTISMCQLPITYLQLKFNFRPVLDKLSVKCFVSGHSGVCAAGRAAGQGAAVQA